MGHLARARLGLVRPDPLSTGLKSPRRDFVRAESVAGQRGLNLGGDCKGKRTTPRLDSKSRQWEWASMAEYGELSPVPRFSAAVAENPSHRPEPWLLRSGRDLRPYRP
jgi:hypothetical protein